MILWYNGINSDCQNVTYYKYEIVLPNETSTENANIKFQHSLHMLLEIGLDVIQAGTLAYEHKNGRYIQLPKHSCIKWL